MYTNENFANFIPHEMEWNITEGPWAYEFGFHVPMDINATEEAKREQAVRWLEAERADLLVALEDHGFTTDDMDIWVWPSEDDDYDPDAEVEVLTIDTGADDAFTDLEEELFAEMQQAEDDGDEELFSKLLEELTEMEVAA